MLILLKIDNGQDQNCVFASVLHQLKGVPADYHPKHLQHQLTKSLIVMRELLKVSSFFFGHIYFLTKHYFTKTFTVCALYLPNIISQKLLQCALCTYQTLFHKNFYSVLSVLTTHYFTKSFTVCALYLPNIISQKLLQCVLCTYQTLLHKNFILNKKNFIRES